MKNNIIINKDLRFDYEDLMVLVDLDTPFTLRDVFKATMQSVIPRNVIKRMICPWIEDYWNEMESKPYEKHNDIEYLELVLMGETYKEEDVSQDYLSWEFRGVGKEGVIAEDVVKFYPPEKITAMINEGYREKYALDCLPVYTIADLEIKVKREISFAIYDRQYEVQNVKIRPNLTLIDLIYYVFWDLSFMGKPEDRDKAMEVLSKRASEIDKWSKEGTLDQHCIPWEEVKEKILKNKGE